MDTHSTFQIIFVRKCLSYARLCVEALEEALALHGRPEIFNTGQGSQFTSFDFTSVLKESRVKISRDKKGRWMDNVFIERLWRSLKYECVYLNAVEKDEQARQNIGAWLTNYNKTRPHSIFYGQTPDEVYNGAKIIQGMSLITKRKRRDLNQPVA